MQPDLRTFDQKANANIAELTERVVTVQTELARYKQVIARLLERQDKMERQFALLSQIQGEMALQATDEDDLEMEPGVAVWTPAGVDDE